MKTRLIYVREEDLQQSLIDSLKNIDFTGYELLFFVELKEVDDRVMPMLANVSKIRLKKGEKIITQWISDYLPNINDFKVQVFDGHPTKSNPSFDLTFSKDTGLHVILNRKNENRILSYLRHRAASHEIKYLSIGDFTEENLGD